MKSFIVVCLALACAADSDPQLLLNSPFYSGLYANQYANQFAYQPVVYTKPLEIKPVEEKKVEEEKKMVEEEKKVEEKKDEIVVPYTLPLAYAAKPIISAPAYTYAAAPAYTYAAAAPALAYAAAPVTYTIQQTPKYIAKNGEVEHIVAKREAEADAQLLYSGAYAAPYATPYAYNYASPYAAYAAAPYVAAPAVYKTEIVNPVKDVQAKTYANDFNPFTQVYAAKGQYVADSVGARHVAKREAEADAQYYYSGLYNYGGYRSAYAYPSTYNTYSAYSAYPYTYGYNAYNRFF